MKEDLQKKQEELKEIITTWMRDNNCLEPGETIVIEIRVKSAEPVEVEIKRDVNTIRLRDFEGPHGPRIRPLEKVDIYTIGQVRNKTKTELLLIRNFSNISLRKLKHRLNKLGVKTNWEC